MSAYLGEIAALMTSLAFSLTSTMFTLAGRRVGSTTVNRIRLILAVLLLSLIHWIWLGSLLPLKADPQRWLWLGLSGIVGLVLGDAFLFQAFVWIGPRLSMLMMSLAPVIASLVAWIFLGETLTLGQIGGIALTLSGIAWVVLERGSNRQSPNRDYLRGILFGLGGATGQALGLVLAKNGLSGGFSPISANLIRMLTAATTLWAITIFQRQARSAFVHLNANHRAIWFLMAGTVTGPLIGVSLSLFAVQQSAVGVASTLMALPPVFLLPISYIVFKERFGWGAVAGTFVAMAGVALLFLV
ncbi:MAG TPA: EamA family transporter [Chloroflexi bacterium]|nr:EamA family transporter [Chloroflexota bacterium]